MKPKHQQYNDAIELNFHGRTFIIPLYEWTKTKVKKYEGSCAVEYSYLPIHSKPFGKKKPIAVDDTEILE
jgi:hypothetical protein